MGSNCVADVLRELKLKPQLGDSGILSKVAKHRCGPRFDYSEAGGNDSQVLPLYSDADALSFPLFDR